MKTTPVECSDGKVYDLLPPGTRICHIKHGLTGRIKFWEKHESGRPSPIPYNIEWDNDDAAHSLMGMYYFWGTPATIVAE